MIEEDCDRKPDIIKLESELILRDSKGHEDDCDIKPDMVKLESVLIASDSEGDKEYCTGQYQELPSMWPPKNLDNFLERLDPNLVQNFPPASMIQDVTYTLPQVKVEPPEVEPHSAVTLLDGEQECLPGIESSALVEMSPATMPRIKLESVSMEATHLDNWQQNIFETPHSTLPEDTVFVSVNGGSFKLENEVSEDLLVDEEWRSTLETPFVALPEESGIVSSDQFSIKVENDASGGNTIYKADNSTVDFAEARYATKREITSEETANAKIIFPNKENQSLETPNDAFKRAQKSESDSRCSSVVHSDKTSLYHVNSAQEYLENSSSQNPSGFGITHSNERPFVCEHCSAPFKTKSNLYGHIGQVHSEGRRFSCGQCQAQFKSRAVLIRHLDCHSDEKPFSCEKCLARFKMKSYLDAHLRTTCSHERPFSCEQCSAAFKAKTHLKKHLLVHSDERPFSCERCQARFKSRRELNVHLRSHSNERPFSCKHCSAAFKSKGTLRGHLLVHSNEKSFSCEMCSARFKIKRHLTKHLSVHSDEKDFACQLCSAQFKSRKGLQYHSRTAHSE